MIQYQITHTTHYQYNASVSHCHNLVYLLPRDTLFQTCLNSSINIQPTPTYSQQRKDYFGNRTCYFSVERPHRTLKVTAKSKIEVEDARPSLNLDFGTTCEQAKKILEEKPDEDSLLAQEFLLDSPLIVVTDELKDYAAPCFKKDLPLLSCVRSLTTKIFTEFVYDPGFTSVATPLDDVLKHRRGVCQDFAQLAIACLRAHGIPARYVSGYIETLPPPGQEKLHGSDATHAWVSVYSPGEGWFDFDPTNDDWAKEQHITTAWGRDYSDVSPLKGVIFGGGDQQSLSVSVDVARL